MNGPINYVMFDRPNHPITGYLSVLFKCVFTDSEDNVFHSVEQFVNYYKAKMFGDEEAAIRIMKVGNPMMCRAIGKEIKGFKSDVWDEEKTEIMFLANYCKFIDNKPLLDKLMGLWSPVIINANADDRYWGIGFVDYNALVNINEWGANWLGRVIMNVRGDFKKKERAKEQAREQVKERGG